MDKLELKDIAPYLPYDIKVCTSYGNHTLNKPKKLLGADIDRLRTSKSYSIYPILRPMPDLTKEITHNGETFVPIELLELIYSADIEMDSEDTFIIGKKGMGEQLLGVQDLPYFIFQKLLEWYFDVFELIERGLAININTFDNGK